MDSYVSRMPTANEKSVLYYLYRCDLCSEEKWMSGVVETADGALGIKHEDCGTYNPVIVQLELITSPG